MVTKENFTCTVHSHVIYLLGILYPFPSPFGKLYLSGPRPFWHQGRVSWKTVFTKTGGMGGGWFQKIQTHNFHRALYFYYYYIVVYIEIITQLTVMQN